MDRWTEHWFTISQNVTDFDLTDMWLYKKKLLDSENKKGRNLLPQNSFLIIIWPYSFNKLTNILRRIVC